MGNRQSSSSVAAGPGAATPINPSVITPNASAAGAGATIAAQTVVPPPPGMGMAPPGGYFDNIPRQANLGVCPEGQASYSDDELSQTFENGIANLGLAADPTTGRVPVSALQAYVAQLEATGIIKPKPIRNVGDNAEMETNMDEVVENDAEFYNRLQDEYCFYEQRYRYALRQFLTLSTSRVPEDNAKARSMLNVTIRLNRYLNSMIEIMNYMAQQRISATNQLKSDIDKRNEVINRNMAALQSTYAYLKQDDSVIRTQKEMLRYGVEKNNHVSNQISVWASLNVLALATIFYVYRSS